MMSTAASTPAVACLARPSQAKLAQRSSGLAGRPLQAAGCRKGSAALGRGAAVCAVEGDAPMVGSDPSKLTVSLPAALNIDDIMARLPHRFPFLLVSYGRGTHPAGRQRRGFARPVWPLGTAPTRAARASLVPRACRQVDRIVEWVPGQYAIGIKNVTVRLTACWGPARRVGWG